MHLQLVCSVIGCNDACKNILRLTSVGESTRAAGLLQFKDREEKIATENAAAVQIARRSNLI
jgi:hypothetical protein